MSKRDYDAEADMRELVDSFLRAGDPWGQAPEMPEWVYDLAMEAYIIGSEEGYEEGYDIGFEEGTVEGMRKAAMEELH